MRVGPPEPGTTCANCKTRPATKWMDTSGMIGHGFEMPWCELCVVRYQIDYISKQIENLPKLTARLVELLAAPEPCPTCGGSRKIPVLDGGTLARPKSLPLPTVPCPDCAS